MPLSQLTTITFNCVHPSGGGSSTVYAPSRIIDQRQSGLVTFIWNVPVPIDLNYINYGIGPVNQERLSNGQYVVWGPEPLAAVSVQFTPRTNFGAESPVTAIGVLIDPQGRTYARLESPRTVQLLIADYIAYPSSGRIPLQEAS